MFTLAVAALAFATPIIVSKLWRQLEKPGAIFDFGYLDQWHVVGQQVGPASTTVVRLAGYVS